MMINLASQPFRRERAQNAIWVLVCIGSLCTLLVMVAFILRERALSADLHRHIEQLQAQLQKAQQEEVHFSNVVAKPENEDVFSTNVFLNELIARRSISWTHVFKDLESTMPARMRLMVVRLPQLPAEDKSGKDTVQLDMVVGASSPEVVIELLKRLQSSNLFGAPSVVSQQPPTQNDPLYKYRVTVNYAQQL
jgi:type IV pilus assembly protein PilN